MGGQFAAPGSTQLLDHFYQTVSSPSTQLSFLVISIKLFGDVSPGQLRKALGKIKAGWGSPGVSLLNSAFG